MSVYAQPVVALIAGVLIWARPELLPKIVSIYLIVVGVIGLASAIH